MEVYAKRIAAKTITVTKQYESNGAAIISYPSEIRQLFTTLLMNAIEGCSEWRPICAASQQINRLDQKTAGQRPADHPGRQRLWDPGPLFGAHLRSRHATKGGERDWAWPLLFPVVSRIVWAARSGSAAACILRRRVLAFQSFCRTENVNRGLSELRKAVALGRGLQG